MAEFKDMSVKELNAELASDILSAKKAYAQSIIACDVAYNAMMNATNCVKSNIMAARNYRFALRRKDAAYRSLLELKANANSTKDTTP